MKLFPADPMVRRRMSISAMLALGLAFIAGCLKIDATLTVNEDGGGVMKLHYAINDVAMRHLMIATNITRQIDIAGGHSGLNTGTPSPLIFDEMEIRLLGELHAQRGIRFRTINIGRYREWQTADIEIGFTNLASVFELPFFAGCGKSLSRTTAGSYQLTIVPPKLSGSAPLPNMNNREIVANLQPIISGMKVAVTINTPSDILNANATRTLRRTATWDYDFDRNPQSFESVDGKPLTILFTSAGISAPPFDSPVKKP